MNPTLALAAGLTLAATALLGLPAADASGGSAATSYSAPASLSVRAGDIRAFGFGGLLCHPGAGHVDLPDLSAATGVANGACWNVGGHLGHAFQVSGADLLSGNQVPLSVILDYTGTGCQSAGPQCLIPDEARWFSCGTVRGNLPTGSAGTTLWVFPRAVDVDPLRGTLCFGSQGDLFGSW